MENWRSGTQSKRYFNNSKNYNWRTRGSQVEEKRNFNRRNEYSTSFHSWICLNEISNQNSDKIILKLIEKLDEFAQFLECNLENDWIVLIIAILAKVCSSSFRQNKIAILKTVAEASFLQKLDNYVRLLNNKEGAILDKNKYFWKNPEEFFVNLLFVCDFFSEGCSNKACEILPKLFEGIEMTVLYLEEQPNVKIGQETKRNITILKQKLNLYEKEGKSGDGFRKWNVGITSEDFLKANDVLASKFFVEGKYDNVEHYLDVQFRVSKEYFVAPFRESISDCIELMNKNKVLKILPEHRLYSDVVFQSIVFTNDEVWLILKFSEQETIDEIFPQHCSNYFRPGTFVLLTKDNFLSVLIGHVIERDSEQQRLIIRLEPVFNNYDLNASYTIVGTKTFYQPYYYALKALQCMSEVDFPMKKYLVDADPSTELPGYLNSSCSVYTIQGKSVDLLGNNWPSADQLKMDSSQYFAFKAALTQKLNVIQGFPGTGKTYLGLQIVKTLLHEDNSKIWYNGTPILIVSASHQALDIFLEGIMCTTSKIIRVGENVSNEKIEKFLLKTIKRENNAYHIAAVSWKKKIKKLSQQIEKWIRHMIQIKKFNEIINFTLLADIDKNVKTSWFSRASNAELSSWLFNGSKCQNVNQHAIEISEIINKIKEEEKNLDFEDDVTAFQEQETILAEPEQTVLLSKSHLWHQIVRTAKMLLNLKTQINHPDEKTLEAKLIHLWKIYQFFQVRISDQALSQPLIKPSNVDYDSPHGMDSIDRWHLYFYWLNLYIGFIEKKLIELQHERRKLSENLVEILKIVDFGIIKRSLVLGMTIHAAVRLQTTLQALKCRIVVVEEGSQILESHLVVSLTKHCEQLILLGDQQKLRPVEAIDDMGKPTTSAISIMERMVNNNMPCHVLRFQHRMSASISKLLVPYFHPEFDSCRSVTQCPAILGIPSRTFFIHQEPRDIDKYNTEEYHLYEAKFLINLACYMRQIGYEPEDITILAAYWDQILVLHNERNKYEELLEGVRIINVVKYHGHESKVILLSLVTNNQHKGIGYLKNEQAIIFALSRAKEYLFMMGNINLLCKSSETWPRIKDVLVEQNCLGNYFPLCCQTNPDHIIKIKKPEDFDKIQNGVCNELCGRSLNCGHRCLKSCHILECDHINTCTEIRNSKTS